MCDLIIIVDFIQCLDYVTQGKDRQKTKQNL